MDDTNSSQRQMQEKPTQVRSLGYLAIGLTLAVALIQLYGSLKGRPAHWPQLALLITLFCVSMSTIMQSRRVRMLLSTSGIIFALVAIYGFITNR